MRGWRVGKGGTRGKVGQRGCLHTCSCTQRRLAHRWGELLVAEGVGLTAGTERVMEGRTGGPGAGLHKEVEREGEEKGEGGLNEEGGGEEAREGEKEEGREGGEAEGRDGGKAEGREGGKEEGREEGREGGKGVAVEAEMLR